MKRLRNTGIYYIIFGIILIFSYAFNSLWHISILGFILLLIYLFLKTACKKRKIFKELTKQQLKIWDLFLVISPFIYFAIIFWHLSKPYKQIIIIPENYEGVVAIQYKKIDGHPKKWIGGFLGIGSSRLIKIDSTGTAKTQFKFRHNNIPLFGIYQKYYRRDGVRVYYENDLDNEITKGADGQYRTFSNKEQPRIYFTGLVKYPLIIFVITKPENYNDYLLSEKEVLQKNNNQNSYKYFRPGKHYLNNKYNHYYKLQEQYLKN